MSELMDREVETREILATAAATREALEHPVRAALVDMLAHEPLSVDEMVDHLAERGLEKAPTTVRHHVDVLREAGLIELKRLEEDRGGVLKYYAATTRLLDFETSEELEAELAPLVDTAAPLLEELVDQLRAEHGDEIEALAEDMQPCSHCETGHFEEYVLVRVVQRALARTLRPEA